MIKRTTLLLTFFTLFTALTYAQVNWITTFETAEIGGSDTFWNGSNGTGFQHQQNTFKVEFDTQWKSWSGFAISSKRDSVTPGFANQYSSISARGVNFSSQYSVVYNTGLIELKAPTTIKGCYITNSTYVALTLRSGDAFSKKFGGTSGNDKDFFKLIATGYGNLGEQKTEMFLADFRSDNKTEDYILNNWKYFDLSVLGDVDSIRFTLSSSDTGQWGMNTPAYFCMDNFNAPKPKNSNEFWDFVLCDLENTGLSSDTFNNGSNGSGGFGINQYFFENSFNPSWNSWSGFALSTMFDTISSEYTNEFSNMAKQDTGNTYLVGYQRASILLPFADTKFSINAHADVLIKVSNSTYAYRTMQNGNQFAKKFGGESGTDKDYLVLKIASIGFDGKAIDTVSHYLADYRSDESDEDFIQEDWEEVVVTELFRQGSPVRFDFWVEGSDIGDYGLNTPAYFCLDDVFEFRQSAGLTENKAPKVSIYPNPTVSKINIKADVSFTEYQILNLKGQPVDGGLFKSNIDVSNLEVGVYFIQLQSEHGLSNIKFIKQ